MPRTKERHLYDVRLQSSYDGYIYEAKKKYIDFNNKRIKELETHFSHLKIEVNDDIISEKEDTSISEKRNISE